MGPKGKDKNPVKKDPETDPKEVVTELQKEFFLFQLTDIERKLERIDAREEELKGETVQLGEKIEEVKKEKGAIISEHEQLLILKEEQKVQKREKMLELSEEIKIRIEKHKKHIEELEKKFKDMVEDMTRQIEALDEEVKILEDHKQNKDAYGGQLDSLEREMEEAEMQHQRDLFDIETKSEVVKAKVKKELQQRLLHLSIEFQQTSQKKIGKSCHRVTQENKAIENALMLMRDEIVEYQNRCVKSRNYVAVFKQEQDVRQQNRDKGIARTVIQLSVIKALLKDCSKLMEKLKTFAVVDAENRMLERRYRMVTNEIERKESMIEMVKQNIEDKIEQTNAMNEASRHLRKSSRRLQVLTRNALKIAEEAMAVRLIPMGGMEEERYMTNDAKIRLFKKRRDSVFTKKGRILYYLFDFLAKAQPTEEDRKLLKGSRESLDIEEINYTVVYGKGYGVGEKEAETKEGGSMLSLEEERKKGPVFYTSEVSLPRSVSALVVAATQESESESYEGEFEGESEEEDAEALARLMEMQTDFGYEGQFDLGEEESEEEREEMEKGDGGEKDEKKEDEADGGEEKEG